MVRGSCLCGAVRFEYDRAVTPVAMCHCSLCRKVSGAAANATIVVPQEHFRWTAGADLRARFSRTTGYSTTFCRICGSPLPQQIGDATAWFVPAGALDDDPGPSVGGHIYVGSKASWDEIGGGAPRFEEGLAPKVP